MAEKVLSAPTLSLISGAGLTSVLTWVDGANTCSSIEHVNYIEAQGTVVSVPIKTAILSDPDKLIDPADRENKKTWSWSVARNGSNQPNQALRRQNGTLTTQVPYIVPYDCTIYAASCEHAASEPNFSTWDFQVEANGVVVYTLAMSNSADQAFDDNVNVQLSQGDRISMFMRNQNQTINFPGGTIYLVED